MYWILKPKFLHVNLCSNKCFTDNLVKLNYKSHKQAPLSTGWTKFRSSKHFLLKYSWFFTIFFFFFFAVLRISFWGPRVYSRNLGQHLVLARKGTLFWKKGTKNSISSPLLYSIPVLCVVHQNKTLHNFCKKGGSIW